ncbi:MAG: hypothetical protein JXN10_12010 [Clostridia bacterium]|nr:hypothetical protein [Clostridia bacterium]MBN2884247.1 hypothetical protein [Clostridia bacterium]
MKLGCNCWASHAGMKMWKSRDPVEMNCMDSAEYKSEVYSAIYKYFLFCKGVDS